MNKGSKLILGITVALITAGSLEYTIGNRIHRPAYWCGGYCDWYGIHHHGFYGGCQSMMHDIKPHPVAITMLPENLVVSFPVRWKK